MSSTVEIRPRAPLGSFRIPPAKANRPSSPVPIAQAGEPVAAQRDGDAPASAADGFELTPEDSAAITAAEERKRRSDELHRARKHEEDQTREPEAASPALVSRYNGRLLSAIDHSPPAPLLLGWRGKGMGRLDPEGHTILFGPGGVGKGSLASYWAVELVRVGHRVMILDHEDHPTEWARRVRSLGGPDASEMILHFSMRGSLPDYAEDMHKIAAEGGYGYAILDSAAVAAPGKAEDSDAASAYAEAVAVLGIPVLTLAHLTKAHDARYPFGSVFWHNLARLTWSLTPSTDGKCLLRNRKANNYRYQGRHLVSYTWRPIARPATEDDQDPQSELGEVWERPYQSALSDSLQEIATDEGRLKLEQILERLNAELDEGAEKYKKDTVRKALQRHPFLEYADGTWGLKADKDP